MKYLKVFLVYVIFLIYGCQENQKNNQVVFGIFTDCQYCACETAGTRNYSLSPGKLTACIDEFNYQHPDFIIQTGDLIDRNIESYDTLLAILNKSRTPVHHVLGNHDFSVGDSLIQLVPEKLSMPDRYYSFTEGKWRFVVLDGNDVSLYGGDSENKRHRARKILDQMVLSKKPNAVNWNGAIGDEQMKWFSGLLEKSESAKEKVIVFCHYPIYPENVHNLWNDHEVLDLILRHSCVKVWINGHNHGGSYHETNNLHFINFRGMVETPDSNAFALVKLLDDSIIIDGYGREPDRKLLLR